MKTALAAIHYKLNHKEMDRLREEKMQLDCRVDQHRYAFVARHRDHYKSVRQDLDDLNTYMATHVSGTDQNITDLLKINFKKTDLYESLVSVVGAHVQVDLQSVKSRRTGMSDQKQIFSAASIPSAPANPEVSAFKTPVQSPQQEKRKDSSPKRQELKPFVPEPEAEQPA